MSNNTIIARRRRDGRLGLFLFSLAFISCIAGSQFEPLSPKYFVAVAIFFVGWTASIILFLRATKESTVDTELLDSFNAGVEGAPSEHAKNLTDKKK